MVIGCDFGIYEEIVSILNFTIYAFLIFLSKKALFLIQYFSSTDETINIS